jgi:predicted CoA-binding protein
MTTATDEKIQTLLKKHRTIAVYGMSRDQKKAANYVPLFLEEKGYRIIPVNPRIGEIEGKRSYAALMDVPDKIDILEVFRPSDQVLEVVKEAVERRRIRGDVPVVWLQKGIRNGAAGKLAEAAGIVFIEDRCMKIMYNKLMNG